MQPMENARILLMAQLKHRKKRPCHSAPVADYGTHYTYAKTCSERLAPCLAVSAEGFYYFRSVSMVRSIVVYIGIAQGRRYGA